MSRIFIIMLMLMALLAGRLPAESVAEQEKLKTIQKELKESRAKLLKTKEEQQSVLGRLVKITHELKQTGKKLKLANEKILGNEVKIGRLTIELRRNEEDLQQKAGMLGKRLNEAYKSSGVNYLELIFDSQSMSDFMNRLYFFEKVIGQDAGLIQDVQVEVAEVETKRQSLKEKNQEIKELAEVISDQKKKIAEQAAEKKKVYEELKDREAEYESKIAELERSSQELQVLIQKKVAERSRAGLVGHGSGTLAWPLRGRLTSGYGAYRRIGRGHRHTGQDIAAPHGTPIVAADSGEIIFSGWWDGYGKAIVIDHGKGRTTVYAHMSRLFLQVGAAVAKGQTIGLVGSTGYSTGPHLHFEVRKNGVPVNPMTYLP